MSVAEEAAAVAAVTQAADNRKGEWTDSVHSPCVFVALRCAFGNDEIIIVGYAV